MQLIGDGSKPYCLSLTKWSERAKEANAGVIKFSLLSVFGTGAILLCVRPSVFRKMLNIFWRDGPIGMKFARLIWLAADNLWVGSTIAQSQMGGLGWDTGLLGEVNLLCGHWCYLDESYHFRKHLTSQAKMWEQIFLFGPRPALAGYNGGHSKRVEMLSE